VRPDFADTVSASELETAIARLDSLIKRVYPTVTAVFSQLRPGGRYWIERQQTQRGYEAASSAD
jgi:hypothetical protein